MHLKNILTDFSNGRTVHTAVLWSPDAHCYVHTPYPAGTGFRGVVAHCRSIGIDVTPYETAQAEGYDNGGGR